MRKKLSKIVYLCIADQKRPELCADGLQIAAVCAIINAPGQELPEKEKVMEERYIIVPLGGNSFIVNKEQSAPDGITPAGWTGWKDGNSEYRIFFKIKRPARLRPVLLMKKTASNAVIAAGYRTASKEYALPRGTKELLLDAFDADAGYVSFAVKGVKREGGTFAFPYALKVEGIAMEDTASFAHEEDRKEFYWIRRGPSVHCGYDLSPAGDDVEWFYNEVRIDPGEDPHGTYGMAIGFHGGYFGMQVCDEGVRKLIFSIWAPYATDDPSKIPPEKRVIVQKKHPLVYTGEFGNEGSGGQSFMNYNWVSGVTYRFLCRIRPVKNGRTEFTSYFYFPESGKWELLCSFLRPETQTWFRGAYSFLESFIDVNGHAFRKVHFFNQWAVTKAGKWVPVDRMRLTGDNTARRANRQDYAGGVEENGFFLMNCGFFDENATLDEFFTVDREKMQKPLIDLEGLEKPDV